MVFCEFWLYEEVSDDEVSIPQYSGIRCDRRGGKRGGSVCVYVKNGICFRSIIASLQIPSCIEVLWLHFFHTSITLLAIYIPPGLSSNNTKSSTVELLPARYYLVWHPITRLRTVPCSRHKATLTGQNEREQKRVSLQSLRTVIQFTCVNLIGCRTKKNKEICDYIVDSYDEAYLIIVGEMHQFPTRIIEAQLNLS